MNHVRIAEWILGLVLSPDRATAIVGDLAEESAAQGSLWFWQRLFAIAVAQVWRDVADHPAQMARLTFRGFGRTCIPFVWLIAGIWIVSGTSFSEGIWVLKGFWLYVLKNPDSNSIELDRAFLLGTNILWTAKLITTGHWIAKRAPGHELSSCVAFSSVGWVAMLAVFPWAANAYPISSLILNGVLHDVLLTGGAMWMRRRLLRRLAQ